MIYYGTDAPATFKVLAGLIVLVVVMLLVVAGLNVWMSVLEKRTAKMKQALLEAEKKSDLVKVVRCRNCGLCQPQKGVNQYRWCAKHAILTTDDRFCSDGIKK